MSLPQKELGFNVDSDMLEKANRNLNCADKELSADDLSSAAGGRSFGEVFKEWIKNGMPIVE